MTEMPRLQEMVARELARRADGESGGGKWPSLCFILADKHPGVAMDDEVAVKAIVEQAEKGNGDDRVAASCCAGHRYHRSKSGEPLPPDDPGKRYVASRSVSSPSCKTAAVMTTVDAMLMITATAGPIAAAPSTTDTVLQPPCSHDFQGLERSRGRVRDPAHECLERAH